MAGDKANMEYLRAMNEYVMMPIRIKIWYQEITNRQRNLKK